jgi:serine/threonine-protein kinase HipA
VLVVERYDRRRQSDGKLSRVHQEDFCQATATPPSRKYENQGGPSLRDIAEILQTTALPDSIGEFFATLMVNVILANSDAHAKNFALMLEPGAPIRLAPRYDLISTFRYPVDHHFAMKVHDVERMENVKLEHVILEASGWGMSRSTAEEVAIDLLNRVPDFVESAGRLTPGVPDDILELAMERATNLKRGLRASGEP